MRPVSCLRGTPLGNVTQHSEASRAENHSKRKAELGFQDVSTKLWGPKDTTFFALGTFLSERLKLLPKTDHSLLIKL